MLSILHKLAPNDTPTKEDFLPSTSYIYIHIRNVFMSTTVIYMLARAFTSASQIIPELEIPGRHLPPYTYSAFPAPRHAHLFPG